MENVLYVERLLKYKREYYELSSYYGNKIKFIQNYTNDNGDRKRNIVSKFDTTRETLSEIFKGDNIYSYENIETLETYGKTFIFMESLTEENRYLKYLLGDSKCIFLNYKHN